MTRLDARDGSPSSPARVLAVGLAGILALAAARAVVLSGPSPSGIDGGNWLAFGTFGRPGTAYPPILPFVFTQLVTFVGAQAATAIAGAAATAIPAIAVLGIAAWAGRPVLGAFAALLVVSSVALGEAAAWGGYPQPIGTGFAAVALVALVAYVESGSRRALAVYGIAFAAVVGTSHLVAVPAAGAAAGIVLWRLPADGLVAARRAAVAVAVGAAPVVVLAPTYALLLATVRLGAASGAEPERILGPAWPAYVGLLVAVPAVAILTRVRHGHLLPPLGRGDRALLVASAAAALSWGVAFLVSGEPRLLHDLGVLGPLGGIALAAVLGPLLWAPRAPDRLREAVAAAGLAGCALVAASGLAAFPGQVAFYRILTPADTAAIQWLATQPLGPDEALVSDESGVPLGWWAEGLTGRSALFSADLRWLRFDAERDKALVANGLLYRSGFPAAGSAATIAAAGVKYVLVGDGSSFGVDPGRVPPGWSVAFASGDAVVLAPSVAVAGARP